MPSPFTENRSTSPSGVPAPDRIPPLSGWARSGSRSGVFRQPLAMKSPPALSPSPPVGSRQAPHVDPPSSESARTPVEAARPPNQDPSAASKPRVSSAVACNMPTFHNTAQPSERTHIQVEVQTPCPPVRPTHIPPLSGRRTSIDSHLASLNGVSVPDVKSAHLSSRSRIKTHPRKMVTSAGHRRFLNISSQINVQPAARPLAVPVEHSSANLGPSYATRLARQDRTAGALPHSSHAKSSNLATIPEGLGALEGHSMARSATPSTSHATSPVLRHRYQVSFLVHLRWSIRRIRRCKREG